ncbi:conserved Plasmodium protein, unknown function [Plasmodium knowlesi strain H]|uniref:Cleavage and polyadenylation specificity factor subunit 2 n=3 Tax=Plasmodium knowlesi TaxID=5850 RepID=A0A5K1UNN0_PLAKH|nr:conserved Plasmodium protein, unknown function [Plasmodium knowlesi strain H]OTN67939.1 Uncharacterized protein PKNOH_S04351900 [Plasmodium knowlesi]CAA9990166.1 conserved Plasmodium protein, unknown function [Plasmodium knowlesi strain H]SBO27445.1 conserved Plasmodium protein, unknown function [Plasmodium knowlesi strain H]SBO28508.1 conserved Plasmodium protein, unknown function [Plasmodium knowlesi strain H]VVS79640.1 conserved Plasmodium protein, unknown function [Plasmodium knowlesi s|eukprot:XP_002258135.1 hypothetical protein, conserved in Plasmodium species [Plasmodium knowlesi strain H]
MILEIVPLYSHKFYSTLLIIKNLDASNRGCKLSELLQDGDKEGIVCEDPGVEGIEEDAEQQLREEPLAPNGHATSKDQGGPLPRKTYNYDYLNNKKDFYAEEKDKNIYVLINCGWDDQFCTEDVKNVLRVCEYVDVLLLTNHSLSYVGCAPLVFQELQKRKRKIPIICHEYVKAYSKYVLLSYFKCTNSCKFFKSFKDDEYFKIVNELFYNVTSLEFKEHYTFKKIICQKKKTVCMLPIYFINNGDNIGSSAVIIKIFNSKILYSVNSHMSDYSFIEKSDVLQQTNVFTYIGNFRYTNKNHAKMVDMKIILGIINKTMNNLGCVLLPVDIDSVFLDLLFHINALLEVSMQRYVLLFLCPYSENFTRLLFASLTYLNSHIKSNFHKNRVNIFKMKNLVCINSYSDFKKYENGYYILFSFPASLNNDTVKKILSTFLTRKKNALIFTKKYYAPSFSQKVCSHYFTHRDKMTKPELSFCFSQHVKLDDEKLYEIYLKEKNNIEKEVVLSKSIGKTVKKKKDKMRKKKKKSKFVFESQEEMLYIKREGNLIGKADRGGMDKVKREGTAGEQLIKEEKYKGERNVGDETEDYDDDDDGEDSDEEEEEDEEDDDDYDEETDEEEEEEEVDDDDDGSHDPQKYNTYYHSDEQEEQGVGKDPKIPGHLYKHSDSNASDSDTEKHTSAKPSANHQRDKHEVHYRSDLDEEYSQDGMEPSRGKTRKGRITIKEEKINDNEYTKFYNHLLKNEHSDDPDNTYYPHMHKIGNVKKDPHQKKVRIKEEPESSDDETYEDESYAIRHPLSKHRDHTNMTTSFVKNEQIFTNDQDNDLDENNEENSSTNDDGKGAYETVHISDYYQVNRKKMRGEKRIRKGSNLLDNTYEENSHSSEMPKMTWKKKLIKYLKTIPTTVQEEKVSIQVDCSVRTFNMENFINQNALNSIIHLMKPQNFVLLPSCNSFFSFHLEMLLHASIHSMDEIKFHSFYIPNFSSSENKRSIYLSRYFCSSGKTLDSVSIPLSVRYENVCIKNIYTMINTTKVADNQLNVFKIKATLSSTKGEPNSQICARRRKRFINEHSTFWSEFSEANYSLAIDNQNEGTQEGEKHTKEEKESQNQGEQNAPNETSQSAGKEKPNEKKPFLDYYMDDEVASRGETQEDEDQPHAGESSDDSDASSGIRDILSNEDNTNEEHIPSGSIYIGEVSMKNLSHTVSTTFKRCLNFTQENQIIIDGKTFVKKEERDIATRGPMDEKKVERTKRNIVWKVHSSLDPSFYFLRNVLKDMYNHVSI